MGVLIQNEPVLKINRHPILIDHETHVTLDLTPGESLASFLHRHIDNMDTQPMVVSIGGKIVKRELWHLVFPKQGKNIEVRFGVQKSALLIVALVVLSIFTMGAAAAVAAGAAAATGVGAGFAAGLAAAGLSATASMAVIGAVQVVGAMIINKVLGPKPPKPPSIERDSVYNISSMRNGVRQYEPLGLLFGSVRVTPDFATIPYTWYENNDQYMGFVLTPGINVNRCEDLYIGDTLMSTYEGVQTWFNGFGGMPNQNIPLFTNVDTIAGGALEIPSHGQPSPWIQRTTSLDTIRIQVDISYLLFDLTSKGKKKNNQETIQINYRKVGAENWQAYPNINLISDSQTEQRRSYAFDVERGQYEVRVRRLGQDTDGSGATANFNFAALLSIQVDEGDYRGIARIGGKLKATGQLNNAPDEVRAMMHANPMPYWNGQAWVTATDRSNGLSNPGAQILQYARGFRDETGRLIAGLGLPDSQIDIESWKAFMVHCAANNYTYDQWLTDGRTHDEIVSTIALAGMGRYSWSPGRFTALWAAEGQGHEGVVNMANIKKGEFQIDYSLAQAADGIEYTYVDRVTWEPKTLRVPAPGVTAMENPARLTGEGIGTEAHAAIMARYHMAQNLYQFKDIVFSQDIEHMAYGQMSIIQLQHDLTQWGFGGRLLDATRNAAGVVTLKFDEPVRAPDANNAYVGLRLPGERSFRVFGIQPFSENSDTVTLKDSWPADAAFPGSTPKNPVWDTIYLYDFKQTPGLRCRVTGIQPGDDLSGASISVVPESDEFWHYVKTGEYIPPKNESLLRPQPTVTTLKAREERVVQGNTVFSKINASWEIDGYAKYVVVTCGKLNETPIEVARTSTLAASWRVDDVGDYIITVRPYDENDVPSVARTLVLSVFGADLPPVLVDMFNVEQLDGGVRRYTWGFYDTTIQSSDMAGVEIRYMPGSVNIPVWENMTPVGDDGFFTSAFEGIVPKAGQWTFALRTVNTSGIRSQQMFVLQKVLGDNLGEVISGIETGIGDISEDLAEQQQRLIDEVQARAQAIAEVNANLAQETAFRVAAVKQVSDGLIQTNADLSQEKLDRAAAILNEKTERVAAVENLATTTQTQFESVAQQIGSVAAGSGTQFDSAKIWLFNTTIEGWSSNGGAPTVVDGMLRPANSTTAYAQSPAGLAIDSNAYRFIKTRIKRVGAAPWRGLVRWITDADQTWDDTKSITIPEPSFDANGIATVDMSDIPWNGASPIRAIRLALVTTQTAAAYLLYDYVAIGRPSPGASTALVQEVQTALQQADQTIASSVTTLGVQMRGQYTGTDPAQLTSGLMYQEMQARVTADQAQVQRIFTMESRMPTGSGVLASAASVTALEQATTTTTNALAQSITTINANLPAMVAQGSNMVLNGGWDQGDNVGWSYSNMGGITIVAEGRSGKCLKVTAPSGSRTVSANSTTDRNIPVVSGKKYRVSAYYKTDAAYNGTNNNGKIRVGNQDGGLIASLTFAANRTDWTRLETVVTASGISALRVDVGSDHTAGTLWVDDVMVEEVTDVLANADGLQALTTTVTNQGGQITAQGNLISALRTDVDGKASNAALQSLQSQVTLQGNDITSLGTAITNVSASLGNVGGENQVANSSFDQSGSSTTTPLGWTIGSGGLGSGVTRRSFVPSTLPASTTAWRWELDNVPVTGYLEGVSSSAIKTAKVLGGERVTLSAYVRGSVGARYFLQIAWRDASGAVLSYTSVPGSPTIDSENWSRKTFTPASAAPAAAVSANVYVRTYGLNVAGQWVEWDNVQLETGTVASGYKQSIEELQQQTTANASATTALTGTVTSLQGTVTALGQSVTTVNARIDNIGGDNLLPNSSFEESASTTTVPTGWNVESAGPAVAVSYVNSPLTGGGRAVRLDATTVAANQWMGLNIPDSSGGATLPRIQPNVDYVLSSNVRGTAGCTAQIILQWRNSANGIVGTTTLPAVALTGEWQRLQLSAKIAVATADRVRVYIGRITSPTAQPIFIEIDNVMLQQGTVATAYTPSTSEVLTKTNANAAATTSLQGTVTSLQGTVTAIGQSITTVQANLDQANRAGSNMYIDSSFEGRAVGTAVASWAIITTGGRTGANALTVSHASNVRSVPLGTFDVAPNRVYYAEGWAKRVGPANGTVQLRFAASDNGASPVYPNFQAVSLSAISDTDWTKVSGYVTIPAGKNRAAFQLNSSGTTTSDTQLIWDDFVLQDVTEAYNAQTTANAAASGVTGLTATVTQQGNKIDATALDLTNLKTQVGDVSATSFNQLSATVTQQGQTQTTQAGQISGIQTSLGNKADAAVVVAMDAKINNNMSGSGNLLANASFMDGLVGWALTEGSGNSYRATGSTDPGLPATLAGVIVVNGSGAGVTRRAATPIPVQENKSYMVSSYMSGSGGTVQLDFYNAAGQYLSSDATPVGISNGGQNIANSVRPYKLMTAPAGAVIARTWLCSPVGNGNFARFFRPMVEEARAGQTQPSPWAAGGLESSASWSVTVRADNRVAGLRLGLEGGTSSFDVYADSFKVSKPEGGARTEFSDGNWRVYDANGTLRVALGVNI